MSYKNASEFLSACQNGDIANVVEFINQNPNSVEFIIYNEFKAFRAAAQAGHAGIVSAMIKKAGEEVFLEQMISTAIKDPEKPKEFADLNSEYLPFHTFRMVAANGHSEVFNLLVSAYKKCGYTNPIDLTAVNFMRGSKIEQVLTQIPLEYIGLIMGQKIVIPKSAPISIPIPKGRGGSTHAGSLSSGSSNSKR